MPGQPGAAPGHGQPGVNPGQPGAMPSPPGAAGPGGQGTPKLTPGSAEDSLFKFCTAMSEGNLTEAAEYISPKAKGTLAQIRDGSLSDDKTEKLKESFGLQGLKNKPSRNVGIGRTIVLGNANNENLTFTLVKEDDIYKLREFKITASKK
jgi:hypothetical protein